MSSEYVTAAPHLRARESKFPSKSKKNVLLENFHCWIFMKLGGKVGGALRNNIMPIFFVNVNLSKVIYVLYSKMIDSIILPLNLWPLKHSWV